MKYFRFLIPAILISLAIVYTCSKDRSDPISVKADKSLKADSIQRIETKRITDLYDSLVEIKRVEDSLHKIKIESLSQKYYALRKVVKSFTPDTVTIERFTAAINSGNLCDSLLMYQDQELAIKDSIISYREIQLRSERKQNEATAQALTDQMELNSETKKRADKARKLNRNIPTIAAISALAGAIFTIILLK